ncbi:helix-turn-helix domain-containing protein [Chitinophaga sancti]|uniref:AraC-type DNA-binding protein n=1 Tax=Chitinophaga sancti TaxID=1004 RepID=A0A1K1RNR5_9BACT|nr:helix-turn-helix transcriptional regulator [Chitinophaga sancti]WQD62615.1 helix-turn-helix transcriptional regulator [Chitinophaga sancti]WQG91815.1 helix-turn-helix transcriptional regulator [Chitinophaga sancti]SFW73485.1 AraC-type DNA-binding protein [Chitinophaga sancti]
MKATPPIIYKSISEFMRDLDMPKPLHPLVALVNYDHEKGSRNLVGVKFMIDFYKISFKKDFSGQIKYGQGYYDFEEGGMAFLAPNQVVTMSAEESCLDGYTLFFHADLIRNYALGQHIQEYGFFSYAVTEALFLSDKEKKVIAGLFENIADELDNNTDIFSQDVLVSQIELLLNYSNRFYNRQFITRKAIHHDVITRMNNYLEARFADQQGGIPSVQEVADHLQVSSRYLSDMLRSLTGQNVQQHIHDRLIERAKIVLSTTRLTVAEIAYQLGFEHPQSFNKLFKRHTHLSPTIFRKSFN